MLINVIGRKTSFLFHIFVLKSVLIFYSGLISSCDKCMLDWNFIAGLIATVAFDIIYFGAIIGTITVIILDNRNPVKTMAWILVLMFLPVVGLVFYFFFGRSQRRVRVIGKQKSYNRLLKKPMAEYLAQDSVRFRQITDALFSVSQHQPGFSFRWKPCGSLYAGTFHDSILVARIAKGDQAHPHGVLYLRG